MTLTTGTENATLFHCCHYEAGMRPTSGCSRLLLNHTPTYAETLNTVVNRRHTSTYWSLQSSSSDYKYKHKHTFIKRGLQNCPAALIECQNARLNRQCDLRSLLNLLVSVVSLILTDREFHAAGPTADWRNVHQLWYECAVRRSTAGFSDWLHRIS